MAKRKVAKPARAAGVNGKLRKQTEPPKGEVLEEWRPPSEQEEADYKRRRELDRYADAFGPLPPAEVRNLAGLLQRIDEDGKRVQSGAIPAKYAEFYKDKLETIKHALATGYPVIAILEAWQWGMVSALADRRGALKSVGALLKGNEKKSAAQKERREWAILEFNKLAPFKGRRDAAKEIAKQFETKFGIPVKPETILESWCKSSRRKAKTRRQ